MSIQPTCGRRLAEDSELTAKLGAIAASTANILELHMTALDLSDERSQREFTAYRHLATQHRAIAAQLDSTASHMAAYRDLPMGRHDMAVINDPKMRDAFSRFVMDESELCALLTRRLEEDRARLEDMPSAQHE